jgi:putative transposase
MYNPKARLRLPGYNYAQAGAYYVTPTTWRMRHLFGEVVDGEMILNDYGRIVEASWNAIEDHFKNTVLDEHVVMPNHMHGIIWIVFDNEGGEVRDYLRRVIRETASTPEELRERVLNDGVPKMSSDRSTIRVFGGLAPGTLSTIMAGFKGAATRDIHKMTGRSRELIWRSRFYDHIVRDEMDLFRIRDYIRNNPARWHKKR